MAPKLYMTSGSPACRSVLMTANYLGLKLDVHVVNVLKGEHLKPEYVKMNPQHTVPTLDDNCHIIWDSHAINAYLVGMYGLNDFLYPADLKKRSVVDQRLHFDSGVLYPCYLRLKKALDANKTTKTAPQKNSDEVTEAYGFLDGFLERDRRPWMACDNVTIADFSVVSTVAALDMWVPIEDEKFRHLVAWFERMQSLACYAATQPGRERILRTSISSIKDHNKE